MPLAILVYIVLLLLTVSLGAKRNHPNMGVVVLLAILIPIVGLIYVICTPAITGAKGRLSHRDRMEIERMEAEELRDKAQASRAARAGESPGEQRDRWDAERKEKLTPAELSAKQWARDDADTLARLNARRR